MTDIKELALRVANGLTTVDSFNQPVMYADHIPELCTRFLAAYLAEQEPVGEVDGFGMIWWKERPPQGTKLFTAPQLPEPAPKEAGFRDVAEFYKEPVCAISTKAQALEALDSMDDFARMAGIDAIGPRKVLEYFITGAAPSSEEVREMVEKLRAYPTRDGLAAADMIERLAKSCEKLLKIAEVAEVSCAINFSGGFTAIRIALKEWKK